MRAKIPVYYRELLQQELVRRLRANPRYSQRAFARDLKVSPSRLNEVLRGRHGLSPSGARQIADRLALQGSEHAAFVDSVESLHGRTALVRAQAEQRLQSRLQDHSAGRLQLDAFEIVADWYHLALLELVGLPAFREQPGWIARSLGISTTELTLAFERLERVGLLRRQGGRWVASEEMTFGPDGIPSEAVRRFHRQILGKATQALELQPIGQRDFSGSVLSIDRGRIDEARADIRKFRRSFIRKYGSDSRRDSVYGIALQFFDLLEKEDTHA